MVNNSEFCLTAIQETLARSSAGPRTRNMDEIVSSVVPECTPSDRSPLPTDSRPTISERLEILVQRQGLQPAQKTGEAHIWCCYKVALYQYVFRYYVQIDRFSVRCPFILQIL